MKTSDIYVINNFNISQNYLPTINTKLNSQDPERHLFLFRGEKINIIL
jgi:hypothetical protein